MKRTIIVVLCVFFLMNAVAFGSVTSPEYTPGEYEAVALGYGGIVSVKLTVDHKSVVKAKVAGADETPNIGGAALEAYNNSLVGIVTVDDVDAVSGATLTSSAVQAAVLDCLEQAQGLVPNESESLVDGVYEGEGLGFSLTSKIPVTVEVQNGRLASISVGENGETMGMIAVVENVFIPRMIQNQSLAVDALTGATASSNGVRQAIINALEGAGMDVTRLIVPIAQSEAKENYETDILIVGMGSSGVTAALSAAESGVSVLAIDKAAKWGGTGVTTSGPANVNAPSQVSAEIMDWKDPILGTRNKAAGEKLVDAEALYETWTEYTTLDGVQGAKPDIISKVIYESGETCDWLESYGFAFNPAVGFVGGKWAIFSSYVGNKQLTEDYFASAYGEYAKMGGQFMLETEATDLVIEEGKVVGVNARKADGTDITIKAKAVILCTGGYAGSDDLQSAYQGEAYKLYGMHTNDGKMIASAIEMGAATYSLGIYPMSHFVAPSHITTIFSAEDNDIPYGLICTAEGMAVNRSGLRFIDERNIAMNAFYQGNVYYYIYSKEQIDILRESGLSAAASGRYLSQGGIAADKPLANIDAVIDYGVDAGFIYKASSIELLADMIGGQMSAENIRSSIKGYQPDTDSYGKDVSKFQRLGTLSENSEYYVAFTGSPYIYSTCGGLDVNENFEVLNLDGDVIPGLFACGTDSIGVLFNEKKAYTNYGGCAQAYCFVSGRDAAAYAAQQILTK